MHFPRECDSGRPPFAPETSSAKNRRKFVSNKSLKDKHQPCQADSI